MVVAPMGTRAVVVELLAAPGVNVEGCGCIGIPVVELLAAPVPCAGGGVLKIGVVELLAVPGM